VLRHEEECTMRSIALCVCAFALIACSTEGTGQTPAAISGGKTLPPTTQGGEGGEGRGGGSPTGSTTGSASGDASVNGGCTYTQGFWKNHPSAWPVMSLTIGGVIYTEPQLLDLFNTAPKGDASLILGHQLIAALLNFANAAAPSAAVTQAINDAQTWMAANRGSNAGLPYGVSAGSAAGQQATALTQTLDNFNSGLAGTPHCGTGGSSGGGSSSGSGSGGSDAGPECVPLGGTCTTTSNCCTGTSCNDGHCISLVF
jgi:hypothetical protein